MAPVRAIVCHSLSEDLSTVRLDTRDVPPPGDGEVLVRLRACALNFPDVLMTQGKYQHRPEPPFVPGMEAAGDVLEVGPGVSGFRPGDRVVAALRTGGLAEAAVAPAALLRPMPARLDYVKASAYRVVYLTAYVALVRRAALARGETLLVHGAGGGVGLAAVEVGKVLGATVIATASTDAKRAAARAKGADHVIDSATRFREEVKRLTGGRGADVVFDPVGGDVFDESVHALARGGRLAIIGFTSGRIPLLPANLALIKELAVLGVRAGEYGRRDPVKGRENDEAIDRWAAEGAIDPYVGAMLPLERAVEGLRLLADRRAIGKIVVTMDGDVAA